MKAFKAYDIRGVYNKDFNADDVYRVGYFLPRLLGADVVLVGRDDRESSPEIFDMLCEGITDAGCDVADAGLCTTPMVYFGTAKFGYHASVQITASHNPPEYNGLKVSRSKALPVGYHSGLAELEELMQEEKVAPELEKGVIRPVDIKTEYLEFLKTYCPDISDLNVAIDCSNGMAGLLVDDLFGDTPHYLFKDIDGTYPNHEPNPLDQKNVQDLIKLVKEKKSDIGIIYDGDADRCMFVDENGLFISPDLITALLARYYLEREKGPVLYDIRTSRAVGEYVESMGGTKHMWKVGHAFAKVKMAELGAIVGGELAGHYYFRDFYNCDSGVLASLIVLQVVKELKAEGKTISQLIHEILKYEGSGEMNFKLEAKDDAMEALRKEFGADDTETAAYDFDGYRIEFADWWFNVRKSNTEPYLRVVIEANSKELLERRVAEMKAIIGRFN